MANGRHHPCDVCGAERKRWQRLCASCFARFPRDLVYAIVQGYHLNKAGWRQAVKRAKALRTVQPAASSPTVSTTDAYRLTAAQLGEHDA